MKKFTAQIKELDGDSSSLATNDIIKAYEFCQNQNIFHAHIIDNNTGEVYYLIDLNESQDFIDRKESMSKNFAQALYEAYEYGGMFFDDVEVDF